jgi:bifunctional non-homologous end joining protein LigD
MASERQHELAVFVFDLMHYDGKDIRPMPLLERRLKLTELVLRSDVHCLHLVQTFEDGAKLLEAAAWHGLEGIVSKRTESPYRSGPSRDWVKSKTVAWRVANRDRWKAFQRTR